MDRSYDERFMAAAIAYSRRARGRTWPNPPVGALLVRDDGFGPYVVGQGATNPPGGSHAEVVALREAGELARGATAYVTLEPCAHYGRTGPCARALAAAGVVRVVFGALDPNPDVAGKGKQILEDEGVVVDYGVLADACREAVIGHITRVEKHRPFVQLKMAVSADGFIGRKDAGQVAISGTLSKKLVHGLRSEVDGILVGIGTVLEDDPELTCRLPGMEGRSPVRIVLDTQARLPLTSKLVKTCRDVPVWVLVQEGADDERVSALEREGVTVIIGDQSRRDRVCLETALSSLYLRGISTVMVEGGSTIAASLLRDGLIDEALIFRSKTVVGPDGILPFNTDGIERLDYGGAYTRQLLRHVGEDWLWRYRKKEK
ncbi:bifunctional diaminohydroxyphosphoribosylaminopyrimidine deaminase/5-amino-6-(5-phosphoribosylamino)uracil reductase RibD [Rhodobacteraceae bacterium RKSG542]|uniref:bifunctional diaminohydroxyphosphoribosylaminopyrimidine deaminase/5-amino-6-(5-phosphoribosylamino)uracil reductase RibD n=1 Tax=Pseudovibrio flavus TaxID=2529854 RepID=UPI0012BB9B51|nr:bifunctional diaminohydroxyphosphoribosylaminopyrimidine deaminase/5-amino-6-(5-phosphoribosylamino)uracil reductase RibD [Pseudovibrio flavus]MTI17378.1 bifunctional diaminohydroxyphosphoribosylaminopyrimidine deaminase/5-amino-6-(5-phosphoribosylamino)uracil reductase RibD [Pseudovibrio flavus]